MRAWTLTHLTDAALLRELAVLVARDRATTAAVLAHIAEVDARRLYVPAGYESMHAYCVDALHLSEDAAYKRIQAARAARTFPELFVALAEGRLHLTAVGLLAPHVNGKNAAELIAAATHRNNAEIRQMLAERFPGRCGPFALNAMPQLAPEQVDSPDVQLAPEQVGGLAILSVETTEIESGAALVAPRPARFLFQVTISGETRDKLRHAQALLSHSLPSGDPAEVLDRALDALIAALEKRKIAATARPRTQSADRPTASKRLVPAQVRRAVWERDQGQCTFVWVSGHRCRARRFLEFDHVDPVARGGRATVERMRLRCRTHNQYEAERSFGKAFMKGKREASRRRPPKGDRGNAPGASMEPAPVEDPAAKDLINGLRGLGVRAGEAQRAAEFTNTLGEVTLEERFRAALRFLRPLRMTRSSRTNGTSGTNGSPGPATPGSSPN